MLFSSLYEDRSDKSSPFRATVTWLCRPAQLPTQVRKLQGETLTVGQFELYRDFFSTII